MAPVENTGGEVGQAVEAVAVPGSVNLVDWYALPADDWGADDQPQAVENGDRTSAASIVAKETRDELRGCSPIRLALSQTQDRGACWTLT